MAFPQARVSIHIIGGTTRREESPEAAAASSSCKTGDLNLPQRTPSTVPSEALSTCLPKGKPRPREEAACRMSLN